VNYSVFEILHNAFIIVNSIPSDLESTVYQDIDLVYIDWMIFVKAVFLVV